MSRKKRGRKNIKDKRSKGRIFHSRKHPRVSLEMDVEFHDGNDLVPGKSRDIGAGGIYIASSNPLPDGSDTQIRFVLDPEKDAMKVGGRVAWTNDGQERKLDTHPVGMGVEFVEKDEQKRKAIGEFVRDITDLLRIMAITNKRRDS